MWGDVLEWREKVVSSRSGEWSGPIVIKPGDQNKKLFSVCIFTNGPAMLFNITQVKPYFAPIFLSDTFILEVYRYLGGLKSPLSDEGIFLIETLNPNNIRYSTIEMNEVNIKENQGLIEMKRN